MPDPTKTTLSPAEAVAFQDAIDAVQTGTQTLAQAIEVSALVIGLKHFIRDLSGPADRMVIASRSFLDTVPADRRAAVTAAGDGKADATPRIWWDNEAKSLVTPETAADIEAIKEARRNPPPPENQPELVTEATALAEAPAPSAPAARRTRAAT